MGDLLEDGLGEVEMVLGRIAPASGVVGQCIVWWAEVRGSDHDGIWKTPFWVVYALDFKASAAAQSIVE